MKREKGLDFIRAMSVIGIVAFHFYAHANSEHKLFLVHANGAWGGTLNYLFFMLSGLVLHKKYGAMEKIPLRRFYYKRWKAVMPAYLFSFASTFVLQIIKSRRFFHTSVPLYRILFTLVGMDGYFNLFFTTFFLVGEWFLSMILILYILYPLMSHLMRKNNLLTLLVLTALYLSIFYVDYWGIPTAVSPMTCLLSMYIGMLFARYPKVLESPAAALTAGIIALVWITVPIGEVYLSEEILVAAVLLIVMNHAGRFLCGFSAVDRAVTLVSRCSFYIFLIQHRLIIKTLGRYNPESTLLSLVLLIGTIIAALIFSFLFDKIIKWILGGKLFLRFEKAVMGTEKV